MYCPEGTIQFEDQENAYKIDLDYCKGCGICAKQCPSKCISMDLEEK